MLEIDALKSPEETSAAIRSSLYKLLREAFSFPTPEFHEFARSGQFAEAFKSVLNASPLASHGLDGTAFFDGLGKFESDFDSFQAEYIRLFDVGVAGPPCPIFAGEYRSSSRMKIMEDLVRCYEYFGLSLSRDKFELPDHVTVQLEFMHYLAFREAHAVQIKATPEDYRRAQRDFLERQLATWLPFLRQRVGAENPLPFFQAIACVADELVRADLHYLNSVLPET
jgi:DMSO reductase family type II enzyme chaperone